MLLFIYLRSTIFIQIDLIYRCNTVSILSLLYGAYIITNNYELNQQGKNTVYYCVKYMTCYIANVHTHEHTHTHTHTGIHTQTHKGNIPDSPVFFLYFFVYDSSSWKYLGKLCRYIFKLYSPRTKSCIPQTAQRWDITDVILSGIKTISFVPVYVLHICK